MNTVTCKGSYLLGTACGHCPKCIKESFLSNEDSPSAIIKKLQHQLEIQTKRVENLKKSNEFYADKSKWGYSGRPKNDSHKAWIIENYDCGYCPDNKKFVGGKLARSCQAIDQELENELHKT